MPYALLGLRPANGLTVMPDYGFCGNKQKEGDCVSALFTPCQSLLPGALLHPAGQAHELPIECQGNAAVA